MRLPSPGRAATGAGILLAVSVLLMSADLAVVHVAGDDVQAVPFFVQTGNATAAGMRVTNAGAHDTIRAYEMFATGACGYTYRNPVRLLGENGTLQAGDRVSFDPSDIWVDGNVTFYVLESVHTGALLRGEDVPTYHASPRHANPPRLTITDANGTSSETRIVRVHINCWGDGRVTIERGPHPGPNVRFAFDSAQPWIEDLPVHQGVDFLYLLRADEQKDNETYALMAENLQRGGEFWTYGMANGSVYDDRAVLPDLMLRALLTLCLALAGALLALALRPGTRPPPPDRTDAALAVAAAGEGHLHRLRRTWGLVGALLVPLLAAATYIVFAVVPFTGPTAGWYRFTGVAVVALDVAVLALWGLAFLRAHQDLAAWRRAWTRLDQTDLDAL